MFFQRKLQKNIIKLLQSVASVALFDGCDCINMDWDLISVCLWEAARVKMEVREMGTDANDLTNRETACSGQRRLVRRHYHSCQTTA